MVVPVTRLLPLAVSCGLDPELLKGFCLLSLVQSANSLLATSRRPCPLLTHRVGFMRGSRSSAASKRAEQSGRRSRRSTHEKPGPDVDLRQGLSEELWGIVLRKAERF